MENNVDMDIDIAHSFSQAVELINKHGNMYFLALLDLNLPDAPNGEIVDYVLAKNILVIVLTGSIDEATKSMFKHKDIVDYVYKGNIQDINYIFNITNRLSKNRNCNVMVVDDSMSIRNNIKKILKSNLYNVYVAAHGEEALKYFEDNLDIHLVLVDYQMPVLDGLELTKKLRQKYSKNELAIIALTAVDDKDAAATFLKSGANDYIPKPFSKEELICRINNHIENIENIQRIAGLANTDYLSGLYNRRYFFENMKNYIQSIQGSQETFAIAIIDLDNFKTINDTHSHSVGDFVIQHISNILIKEIGAKELISRFGGDEFCIALKDIGKDMTAKILVNLRGAICNTPLHVNSNDVQITCSIGFSIGNAQSDIDKMLEKADEALYVAKHNGRNRVELR